MITGAKLWRRRDTYYSQENNPTEAYNKALLDVRVEWLESCGPTSAVNCLAAMGFSVDIQCPGVYKPQPEEVLMDFFNDPRNGPALDKIREVSDDIPENRVPQYYPYGVKQVFGVDAEFRWGLKFQTIVELVGKGHAIQICLKNPGHYIAVVAVDYRTEELIYNDSWPSRFDDRDGFNRRMGRSGYEANVQPYYILYGV